MKIGGQSESVGEKCPAGVQVAVLAAVDDVGYQEGFQGKVQRKMVLTWETQHRTTKGRQFVLFQTVTNSTHEKSTMFKYVGTLLGRKMTEAEQKDGIDDTLLVGKCAQILVQPSEREGGWPYIDNVMPLVPGQGGIKAEGDYSQPSRFVTKLKANQIPADKAKALIAEQYAKDDAEKAAVQDDGSSVPF